MRFVTLITFLISLINTGISQENTQLRIPRSLEECYRDPLLVERDYRLPMTIGTLIDLIEKVENSPGYNKDIRQLAVSLVHRFRLDGVTKAPGVTPSASVLPYSPSAFQFSKHRVLLTRLIQGDAHDFPNETLSAVERCTLHYMMSSTFELRVRGDESQRCSQLAQYRSERIPRSVSIDSKLVKNNFAGDVEFLEKVKGKIKSDKLRRVSNKLETNIDRDLDEDDYDEKEQPIFNTDTLVDVASDSVSQCPVESGVIHTPWGAVAAGPLITGIAAGLQPQKVQLKTLLALSPRRSSSTVRNSQQNTLSVDNKWAATLAGDLAEVALIQVPISQSYSEVGASGAWNTTINQKWYFLSQREKLEMTDAEIRGGLDGLIIASKISEWRSKASNLKLSQVLSMYYSQRGVLDSGIRACDRRKLFAEYAPVDEMKSQANAFANVLDREMQLTVTLQEAGIKMFSELAADKLSAYIPTLNDLSCESTSPTPNDPVETSIITDLYVYLDTQWPYEVISDILGYILSKMQIRPFGSRVTLLNARDANIIVNSTDFLGDIHQGWNYTTHQQQPSGFNLPSVLRSIHNISVNLMYSEKRNSSVGGRSLIALVVPYTANVNDGDSKFSVDRLERISEDIPDLKFLYLASGSVSRFTKFVKSESKDLFMARQNENIATQANPVIKRIGEIPRRIINCRCGPEWHTDSWGQDQMSQYVSPQSVNFYRLAPNYFFEEGGNRKMRIQGQGTSTIMVCTSRHSDIPRANMTNKPSDLNCRQVTSNSIEISLSNRCEGEYVIHLCNPIYISVEAPKQIEGNGQNRCTDDQCKSPDDIRFLVQTENLSCFNGIARNLSNIFIIIVSVLSTTFFAIKS